MDDLQSFREEAARLGMDLTDDDLRAISAQVIRVRAYLAAHRPQEVEDSEPSYYFAVPRPFRNRKRQRSKK